MSFSKLIASLKSVIGLAGYFFCFFEMLLVLEFAQYQYHNLSVNFTPAVILIPLQVHVVFLSKDLHFETFCFYSNKSVFIFDISYQNTHFISTSLWTVCHFLSSKKFYKVIVILTFIYSTTYGLIFFAWWQNWYLYVSFICDLCLHASEAFLPIFQLCLRERKN